MVSMSTDIIKRCPFCGETLRKIGSKHRGNQFYVHDINGPDCILKEFAFKADDEEKIKRWNTRKPLDRIAERLEDETIALEDDYGDFVECIPKEIAIEIVKEEGGIDE